MRRRIEEEGEEEQEVADGSPRISLLPFPRLNRSVAQRDEGGGAQTM